MISPIPQIKEPIQRAPKSLTPLDAVIIGIAAVALYTMFPSATDWDFPMIAVGCAGALAQYIYSYSKPETLPEPKPEPEPEVEKNVVETVKPPVLPRAENPPIAMPNAGNDCFINSFVSAFLGGNSEILADVTSAKNNASEQKKKNAFARLETYLTNYQNYQETGTEVPREETHSLRGVIADLGFVPKQNNGQEDASEALNCILNAISENLPTREKPKLSRTATLTDLDGNSVPLITKFGNPESNYGGRLFIPFNTTCSFTSMFKNAFFEDKQGQNISLETTDADNTEQFFLIKSLQTYFDKAPEHLSIVFNRFSGKGKIQNDIKNLEEILEVKEEHFLDGKAASYQVTGAVIHIGGTGGGGHYQALRSITLKDGARGYFLVDDGLLKKLTQEDFKNRLKKAYMVFYTKISI